ncbi:hypothetical protein SDC9_142543 [bioreactor metagenome]|uniref:Uncharacterized protein n=1 Tax=bioreactor metagenome TaxID=1076179 RepID=A0A645E1G4_9ZZZZ
MQCHSLCQRSCRVFDRQVLHDYIIPTDFQRISFKCTHIIDQSMVIIIQDGFFLVLSDDVQIANMSGNFQLFFIKTFFDENSDFPGRVISSY